jgi:VWFA-related protein
MKLILKCASLLLASLWLAPCALAQGGPPAQMVLLNVRVTDEKGHAVADARREDFTVVEDGVPQTISFFSKAQVPLSYGLVVDNSGSLRVALDKIVGAAKTIVASNKPGDETFLVRFISNDKIEHVLDFTSDPAAVIKALDTFFVEGGQTAVIDAVHVSFERLAKNRPPAADDHYQRRALVLITDGEDGASYYTRKELKELLNRHDIQIFVIGLVYEIKEPRKREKAVDLLTFIAQETGGRAFFAYSAPEVRGIAEEITSDLRTQYLVGYTPAGGPRKDSFHSVQVTVADAPGGGKRAAVTRVGYVAGPQPNR